jgi:hypothetical protein
MASPHTSPSRRITNKNPDPCALSRYPCKKDFYMRCLWNVLDVNKHISNTNDKAKAL